MIIFGTGAYLSLGKLNSNIDLFILRDKIGSSDFAMLFGRTLLILSLYIGSGLNMYPIKIMTLKILNIEMDYKNNIIISMIYTILVTMTAVLISNVRLFVSIAGSFSATILIFTVPGICAIKLNYSNKLSIKIVIGFWISILTLMGMLGSYLTFKNSILK